MWRIRGASGQAAAKASRTRQAVSMTRVPSFKRRSRRVANSAVASACALGIASRTVRISQYAAVCRIRRIWLASGLRQSGLETGDDEADIEPLLCGLDAGAGATVLVPGLGLITGLCETAQAGFMIECAP